MKRLNRRLLAWAAGITIGLSGALAGLHLVQSDRINQDFLSQADLAEQHGRPDQTIQLLRRYLAFAPADQAARARLGRILADRGPKATRRSREEALFLLERVLFQEPERHDLRWIVVRLAEELRRPELSFEHLHALHRALPEDGAIDLALGRWHEGQGRYSQAAEWYRKAIRRAPSLVDAYARLADVLRHHLEPSEIEADRVMENLVRVNGTSGLAHLARWRYRKKLGRWDEGAADMARAIELAPDSVEVLLAAAELAQLRGSLNKCWDQLDKAQRLFPADDRVIRALVQVEVAMGRRADAIARLRKALPRAAPDAQAEFQWTLANLLIDEGHTAEAEATISRLPASRFPATAVDYLHGRLQMARERWADAVELLERARPLTDPAYQIDLHLGYCYQRLNQPEREFSAYLRATQCAPQSAPGWLGLAHAAGALGRHDEAQRHYRHALSLSRSNGQAVPRE